MSFRFASARPRRRPSLTPMIDVVFLLLVFFMLAARFGQEGALTLTIGGGGAEAWVGPPRLVQIDEATLRLNGETTGIEEMLSSLTSLTGSANDLILVQPSQGVTLQRLLDVMAILERAGFTSIALIDP